MNLVANRECGKCTVCCKVLTIDDPEFQKLPGVLCPDCKTGGGCQIYETRPSPCRGFFCGWRALPELDDKWRPDKSGVMIRFQQQMVPPGYQPVGFQFLIHDTRDAIKPQLVNFMSGLIARRVAVFLALRGPDGFSDVGVFLNEALGPSVAKRDRNAFVNILRSALESMSRNKFERVVLKHANPATPA